MLRPVSPHPILWLRRMGVWELQPSSTPSRDHSDLVSNSNWDFAGITSDRPYQLPVGKNFGRQKENSFAFYRDGQNGGSGGREFIAVSLAVILTVGREYFALKSTFGIVRIFGFYGCRKAYYWYLTRREWGRHHPLSYNALDSITSSLPPPTQLTGFQIVIVQQWRQVDSSAESRRRKWIFLPSLLQERELGVCGWKAARSEQCSKYRGKRGNRVENVW